jgi:hypothetical protein
LLRRVVVGARDIVVTLLLGAGWLVAAAMGGRTGRLTPDGFIRNGWPAMLLFALIIGYFVIGRRWLGGTLWDRVLGIPRP